MTIAAIDYRNGVVTYEVETPDGILSIPCQEDWDVIPTLRVGMVV